MRGLMMDFPLTLDTIVRRAEQFFPNVEIVGRRPDRSIHRSTYGEVARRARHLAAGLESLGLAQGDRVATLAWNNIQHCETYFGVPCGGYVCHTLNLRLHPDELAWIATNAGDRAIIVDDVLLPLLDKFRDRTPIEHVIVINSGGGALPAGALDFEAVIARGAACDYEFPCLDENAAAAMCYTSGTTGKPKGVVYSHRSQVLHCFGECLSNTVGMGEADCGLAIVPLFHANAWGFPYAGAMIGMRQVFPGPHLDAASLLELIVSEKVTLVAGVPTIMMGVLAALDASPGKHDLSAWRMALIGGSAVPQHMIKAFRERHDVTVQQGWGMTETSPLASVARPPAWFTPETPEDEDAYRAMQGRPAPFVEIRARNAETGIVAWDGEAMGELEVRGPWVVGSYYHADDGAERFTSDGWFRTGDLVSIHPDGCIQIRDRTKDVIKSGGEWVSSVALENAIMGHPAVAEAAVIGVPEPKWMERPIAIVVCKPGQSVTHEALVAFLEPQFPKWWMPDATEFVDALPKSGAGKFQKSVLRERFAQRLQR
ncbi:MAG: long-chain fatty acid--CoA ligase [Gemmatimonadota bacterium]